MSTSFFTLEFLVIGFLNKIPSSLYWVCMVHAFPWFMILWSTADSILFHSYFVHFVLLTWSFKESIIFVSMWVYARKRERQRETETGRITLCGRPYWLWVLSLAPYRAFYDWVLLCAWNLPSCFSWTEMELPASAPMLSSHDSLMGTVIRRSCLCHWAISSVPLLMRSFRQSVLIDWLCPPRALFSCHCHIPWHFIICYCSPQLQDLHFGHFKVNF